MSGSQKNVKRVLGIDFETAASHRASACSVGLYLKDLSDQAVLYEQELLIDPQCTFNYFNMQVHGITPAMVKGAPTFDSILPTIEGLIDDDTIVVAHNASFDISVLRKSCEAYAISPPNFDYMCTLQLSRALVPGLVSYSLPYVTEALRLNAFDHHHAVDDARACANVFESLWRTCEGTSLQQLEKASGVRHGSLSFGYCWSCSRYRFDEPSSATDVGAASACACQPVACDESNPFFQKTVVFTGVLAGMPRKEAENLVVRMGGFIGKGVTRSTNYVIHGYLDPSFTNGKDKSNKLLMAEKYVASGADIQVISEVDFFRMMELE